MTTEDKHEDQSTTAKVKEAAGWVTGDREVEAEGRADTKSEDDPEVVEQAKDHVRADHGDVRPA
jgi:uncharacterized protein YjbJ (UPF0337 family)